MEYTTKSPKETEKLAGFLLAPPLKSTTKANSKNRYFSRAGFENKVSKNNKKAMIIALEGELGAGKTVFTRGLARALKIKAKIKSPTFNIIKNYKIPGHSSFVIRHLYHLDCYRLRDHRDLEVLGIKEIINDPANIVMIEWADRVKKILPKKHIEIHIDHIASNQRKVKVTGIKK